MGNFSALNVSSLMFSRIVEPVVRTEAEKMARTWFDEIPSCCSLTLLLGPAWVLLKYALQTIFSISTGMAIKNVVQFKSIDGDMYPPNQPMPNFGQLGLSH